MERSLSIQLLRVIWMLLLTMIWLPHQKLNLTTLAAVLIPVPLQNKQPLTDQILVFLIKVDWCLLNLKNIFISMKVEKLRSILKEIKVQEKGKMGWVQNSIKLTLKICKVIMCRHRARDSFKVFILLLLDLQQEFRFSSKELHHSKAQVLFCNKLSHYQATHLLKWVKREDLKRVEEIALKEEQLLEQLLNVNASNNYRCKNIILNKSWLQDMP